MTQVTVFQDFDQKHVFRFLLPECWHSAQPEESFTLSKFEQHAFFDSCYQHFSILHDWQKSILLHEFEHNTCSIHVSDVKVGYFGEAKSKYFV